MSILLLLFMIWQKDKQKKWRKTQKTHETEFISEQSCVIYSKE